MLSVPRATYRLQFRDGMTFDQAAGLAEYLARLGISDLYASPLFAAAPGSGHGYDGISFTAMEPAIGGDEGFDRFSAALREAGLRLLLDFVPNHMAADERNGWWRAVLEWGSSSPYARYFDIDWTAPKLMLPILGAPYGEALQDGTFGIAFDTASGSLSFTCYDRQLPMTPPSYGILLSRVADSAVAGLAQRFSVAPPEETEMLKRRLAEAAAEPGRAAAIGAAAAAASSDTGLLHDIHEAQAWRLAHWRLAREALTYRRFFEIAELICLRIEEPAVFDAVHARLFALIAEGRVDGVRLDHVDGIADPKGYVERLQHRISENGEPRYLLVEKILEPDETLRPDWPVAGTTGYEFIGALSGLFVDWRRDAAMDRAWHGFTGTLSDYTEAARDAKREIFERNLAAELAVLTDRARAIAATDIRTRDFGTDTLRRAIIELAAALPVYRTYIDAAGPAAADRALLADAASRAANSRAVEDSAALDFLVRLLLLDLPPGADRDAALAFVARFQQTTGPVMAKAVEDTMFYRYNRLIALNEVGGSPSHYGAPRTAFHVAMADRQGSQPAGLSATTTHDTKRGEDARARLYVLSEMPEAWQQAVARWTDMNAPHRTALAGGPAPEPAAEWLFYQALAGAWPADFSMDDGLEQGEAALAELRTRMAAYMEKVIREAKTRTSWTNPDEAYETAVSAFVTAALSRDGGRDFLHEFARTCRPLWLAGAVNGLAQLAIKLTAPGVPDIYQGAELWDFSLVDPDNRTPVDFGFRRDMLERIRGVEPAALLDGWTSGAPKMALTEAGLRLRAAQPELFAAGDYIGLSATGEHARHVVAFSRTLGGTSVVVVVPRLVLMLLAGTDQPMVPAWHWNTTAVLLPDALHRRQMRDAVTGTVHHAGDSVAVADVLARFPVALLLADD